MDLSWYPLATQRVLSTGFPAQLLNVVGDITRKYRSQAQLLEACNTRIRTRMRAWRQKTQCDAFTYNGLITWGNVVEICARGPDLHDLAYKVTLIVRMGLLKLNINTLRKITKLSGDVSPHALWGTSFFYIDTSRAKKAFSYRQEKEEWKENIDNLVLNRPLEKKVLHIQANLSLKN